MPTSQQTDADASFPLPAPLAHFPLLTLFVWSRGPIQMLPGIITQDVLDVALVVVCVMQCWSMESRGVLPTTLSSQLFLGLVWSLIQIPFDALFLALRSLPTPLEAVHARLGLRPPGLNLWHVTLLCVLLAPVVVAWWNGVGDWGKSAAREAGGAREAKVGKGAKEGRTKKTR
ncbi:hypothetical protein M427DRAFT_132917 [Gonapodya prolifera JEL478]|uniref:Uncharacterized protein n=1 Tax=Gonapodya prolifera (strain JEL478) TaxID=1344416 RepID=A0A139ANT8_GONPJ|nr:hypothetical protein M427DRAFT_132917 [Gonapodya prolifera JEL478]|eukprot:KXS18155.1 hypothetical protein M427DRAFT_132917 [Gonapodya prolifera JEL478]